MQFRATKWQPRNLADAAAELLDKYALGEIDEVTLAQMLSVQARAWLEMQRRTASAQIKDGWDKQQTKGGDHERDSSQAPGEDNPFQKMLDELFQGAELEAPSGEGDVGERGKVRRPRKKRDPRDGLPHGGEPTEGDVPKGQEGVEGHAMEQTCKCGHIRAWHLVCRVIGADDTIQCQRCKCEHFVRRNWP